MHLNSSCFETQVSDKTKFSAHSVFLKLFSHRYFSITKSDKWTTVKHFLTDALLTSLWKSPNEIVGVRFGSKTQYCLLDIDTDSIYHPNNSNRLPELLGCLEEVGFTRYIPIQSSHSEGLHIYFVFSEQLPTFKVASLLASTLKDAGFPLMKGELEIFPNTKTFVVTNDPSKYTKYNGHRLPLQEGSFVLDENYEPCSNNLEYFIACCKWCAEGIDIDEIKENLSKPKKIKKKNSSKTESVIEKWKEDIERVIQTGWTDYHQTNQIIYKLAQKVIVFDDTIYEDKLSWMVSTIKEMPGYKEYCRHQHEIDNRCQDWLNCLLKKGYHWSYGTGLERDSSLTFKKATESVNTRNLEQEELVTFRLIETLHHLSGQLFNSVNSLFKAIHAKGKSLFDKGFSNRTLYKYKHLWAPMMVKNKDEEVIVDIPESEGNLHQKASNLEEAETFTEQLLPTPPPNNNSICFPISLGEGQGLNAVPAPKDLKALKTKNQKTNFINKFIEQLFKNGIKTKIVLQIFRIFCKFLLQNLENLLTKAVGQILGIEEDTLGQDIAVREEMSSQVINGQQSIVLENLDNHSIAGQEEIPLQVIDAQQSVTSETLNSYLDDDGWPIFVDGGTDNNVSGDVNDDDDDDDDDDDEIIVVEVAGTQINIDSNVVISSVNNDYLRSNVNDISVDDSSIDISVDDSSIDISVDDSSIDISVDDSSIDISVDDSSIDISVDINTFDDNAISFSDIAADSSDPDDIDDYVFDVSVVDSNERSNVFSDSEDFGDIDFNDITDDGSNVIDIYSDSINDNNEISYIDSIDNDGVDDIINSTDYDVNIIKSYRKNCHPFHYVRPSMTIKQIKMMYPKFKWLEVSQHFGYSLDDLELTIKDIKSIYPESEWLKAAEHFGYSANDLVD